MLNYYNSKGGVEVTVYSHLDYDHRAIRLHLSHVSTFASITNQLVPSLFQAVLQLRLFNTEGVEVFQEDLPFLKQGQVLHATNCTTFHSYS